MFHNFSRNSKSDVRIVIGSHIRKRSAIGIGNLLAVEILFQEFFKCKSCVVGSNVKHTRIIPELSEVVTARWMRYTVIVIDLFLQSFVGWFEARGPRILGVLIAALIIDRIIHALGKRTIHAYLAGMKKKRGRAEIDQRTETLSGVLARATSGVSAVIIAFLLLPEFGVNVGSLFAGAGLLGLAVGIGAQNVIRDALAGLFCILEDQFGKGDRIRVAGVEGIVQEVTLRKTVLKDTTGARIYIPNSEMKIVVNKTQKTY